MGERVGEKVAGMELQAILKVITSHVLHEDGLHLWKVETTARQVRLSACNLNGSSALCGANVEECLVAIPRKGLCQCAAASRLPAVMPVKKTFLVPSLA